MIYRTIEVIQQDWVRTIRLSRPDRRNAITPEMQLELIAALDAAGTSDCRVVVLEGAGEAFCSGLDLSVLQNSRGKTSEEYREEAIRTARMFRYLYDLPKATIAAVHGAAVAGGAGLATICDFTLAVPTARFGFTEARIGFVPALVSAYLRLQIGDKAARDILLTGRLFDAAEAQRLGLVTEIVAPDALTSRVQELSLTLAANSPASIRATKRLLAEQNHSWLSEALKLAMEANAQAREMPDFNEGVTAYLEKRKPRWAK
ncbi:MAG: enoyl-CoA hydratase [Acidobacteria bacterium]|nr:enoyl-CoA hydratase [Acidobacteriota bacterium]